MNVFEIGHIHEDQAVAFGNVGAWQERAAFGRAGRGVRDSSTFVVGLFDETRAARRSPIDWVWPVALWSRVARSNATAASMRRQGRGDACESREDC